MSAHSGEIKKTPCRLVKVLGIASLTKPSVFVTKALVDGQNSNRVPSFKMSIATPHIEEKIVVQRKIEEPVLELMNENGCDEC